jgi:tetratricopeptide (TPR) repeat protein
VAAHLRIAALVAAARTSSAAPKTAARDALEKALAAADERVGSGHPATHGAVVALAEAALGAGDVEAARGLVERLLDRNPPRPDPVFEERLVALVDRTATAAGEDGVALRGRLIAVRETQFGDDHAHTAHALALFGGVRLAAGDAESAANFTRRALDLQSDALPDDHPDLGATLLILAESLRAVGQMDEAGPHFTRALTIWERSAGADHPVTLETVRGLARTALGSGDSAAALPHLERLRAAATGKGSEAGALPEHTESLPHLRLLVTLAGILAEEGERDRSRQIVVESLALSCWQPAPYAEADVFETLAVSMAEIARVFKALEEPESSTEAIRRARGYATRVPSPKELLARVDAMLERETAVGSDL